MASAVSGQTEAARAMLSTMESEAGCGYVSPWFLAKVHAALGETDRAVERLEKAYIQRSSWLVDLGVDPELDGLRGLTRFRELNHQLGLDERRGTL